MEDDNPRPLQRPRLDRPENGSDGLARMQLDEEARRVEAIDRRAAQAQAAAVERASLNAAVDRAPLNMERDYAVAHISHQYSGQSSGAPSGEGRYANSQDRGGGGEFRSFHAEMNAHLASREPNGENTRRIGANGRDVVTQTSAQSSREGLDHPAEPGRTPATLTHADLGRSNLDVRSRAERGRNSMEID